MTKIIAPDGRVTLHCGDCLQLLKTLDDCSIDSVVTDPPYHLTSVIKRFGAQNAAPAKHGTDGLYARQSRGFMGRTWDGGDIAFRPELWSEVWRVLKPGGHLLAFSGTRTYHRMAVAIDEAGFEVRDMIAWMYGTGFPKSHDVAKSIDKARTEDIEPTRAVCRFIRASMEAQGMKSVDLAPVFNCHARLIDHWAARDTDSQPSLPTPDQWETLKLLLSLDDSMDVEVARLQARKGERGDAYLSAPIEGEHARDAQARVWGAIYEGGSPETDRLIRAPNSDDARRWEGWGTALKPALEPICLARKPLVGTVAQNVLVHSTGALNIDGCRIASEYHPFAERRAVKTPAREAGTWSNDRRNAETFAQERPGEALGRWPANVIRDGSDEVIAAFPETAPSKAAARGGSNPNPMDWGNGRTDGHIVKGHNDDGGSAARFFYSAKANKADRAGSKHPTIKPIALMRYLCRLVTPPGGVVLDPFAGSGTTGQAALEEGFSAVLIEREAEYQADIKRRMGLEDDVPDFMGLDEPTPLEAQEAPVHEKPCATHPWKSFRYRGPYGWIMIGAAGAEDALKEAERSLETPPADLSELEVWDPSAGAYKPVAVEFMDLEDASDDFLSC